MNFLVSGYLPRHGKNMFWKLQGLRTIQPLQILPRDTDKYKIKQENSSINTVINSQRALIIFSPDSALPMQVRFKQNHPKLHSDLQFPNFDNYRKPQFKNVKSTSWGSGDEKPGISYIISFFGLLAASYAVKSELTRFITYMSASADVLALSSIEVDLSKVIPGGCLSYKWRGKPLFVKNRTATEIDAEASTPVTSLRDPQSPEDRTIKPEWLIVIGICTHLGCVPIPNSGEWVGGFYCPCHGSHYDNVGRARKGPAPLNLEVPPYKFLTDTKVLVG